MLLFPECSTVIRGAPRRSQVCRCAPRRSAMQCNPSPGRQAACNSPSEGRRFRQSRPSRPEHPGVSDGNQGCCWCSRCSIILLSQYCNVQATIDNGFGTSWICIEWPLECWTCCEEPFETIDWLSPDLGCHLAYIVAASPNPSHLMTYSPKTWSNKTVPKFSNTNNNSD